MAPRKTPSAAEAAAIAAAEAARLAAAKKASIAARERALEILLAEIAKDRASRPQQWAAPMTPSRLALASSTDLSRVQSLSKYSPQHRTSERERFQFPALKGEAMTSDAVAKSTVLTRKQFMNEYGFSDSTERRGRTGGESWPPHIEIGPAGRVYYRRESVEAWLQEIESDEQHVQTVAPVAGAPAPKAADGDDAA